MGNTEVLFGTPEEQVSLRAEAGIVEFVIDAVLPLHNRPLLGTIFITEGARKALRPGRVYKLLDRHGGGDWGLLCAEDKMQQDRQLAEKSTAQLMSAWAIDEDKPCAGHGENTVWIITYPGSETTVLVPEEY